MGGRKGVSGVMMLSHTDLPKGVRSYAHLPRKVQASPWITKETSASQNKTKYLEAYRLFSWGLMTIGSNTTIR